MFNVPWNSLETVAPWVAVMGAHASDGLVFHNYDMNLYSRPVLQPNKEIYFQI